MENGNNIKRIDVVNLKKKYKLYNSPSQQIADLLFANYKGKDFIALNDVSFSVYGGEAFAVIGRNGSGKSTLLQILAGILNPTFGEVKINGRVAALLELGSGFNPEVTGYDNIFMNAAIYGLSKKEIEDKIEEIINFADIGDHINDPVKTYSSGMFVRLAFSVAINVDADILLIDEALAVGDIFFRQKCYAKLAELKAKGVTIVLVTHNMSEVEQFCDSAIYLKKGNVIAVGDSRNIVKEYYLREDELNNDNEKIKRMAVSNSYIDNGKLDAVFPSGWRMKDPPLQLDQKTHNIHTNNKAAIRGYGLYDKNGCSKNTFEQGEEAYLYVEVSFEDLSGVPALGMAMYNQRNTIVHGKSSFQMYNSDMPIDLSNGTICFLRRIKMDIAEGEYTYELGVSSFPLNIYNQRHLLQQEEMDIYMDRMFVVNNAGKFLIHTQKIGTPTRMRFYGDADLIESEEVIMV